MTTKLTIEQAELFGSIESELRQQAALHFIKSGYENKTHSYIAACKKLNKKVSKNPVTSGAEVLNYPSVVRFIDSVKASVAESVQIDAMYVLMRLKEIDELDLLDIMLDDLTGFKSLSEWPKVWRTSLSGIDIMQMSGEDNVEAAIKKIKWPDKVKNLELIGRHVSVKAWDKEVEKSSDSLADSVNKLIDRLPN